jgi:serine/threonine protein kinase
MPEWIGKTIGKVRIDKLLARGGMAEVYLGTHLTLERPVAVKLLHSHIEQNAELLERFHREAKVVAGLRHPNVQIFDFDGRCHPYIVMEYLKGQRRDHLRVYMIETSAFHRTRRLLKSLPLPSIMLRTECDPSRHQTGQHYPAQKSEEIPLRQLTNDVEAIIQTSDPS